jgi:hypothetical protein
VRILLIIYEPYQGGIIRAQQMLHLADCPQPHSLNREVTITRVKTEVTDTA